MKHIFVINIHLFIYLITCTGGFLLYKLRQLVICKILCTALILDVQYCATVLLDNAKWTCWNNLTLKQLWTFEDLPVTLASLMKYETKRPLFIQNLIKGTVAWDGFLSWSIPYSLDRMKKNFFSNLYYYLPRYERF